MPPPTLPEIACYGLPGHGATPQDLVAEVRQAEQLGVGSLFLSERFTAKDAAVMAGLAIGASERIGIATAATNHQTRHLLVTATMAMTAHRASGGRYALGLGRGFDALFDVLGLPRVTSAQLTDAIGILRTLWNGGAVVGHDGPAGRFPYLQQHSGDPEPIPVLLTAIGDRTLELAGRIADAVVLHSFLTDEALARSVQRVRAAAADAGRDPASVRIWAVLVTVPDHLDEQTRLRRLVGRLATYLQGYGQVLVRANGWDLAVLERFRADEVVCTYGQAFDAAGDVATLHDLAERLIPESWLAAAATGTPQDCAHRIEQQFQAGADSVVLHGSSAAELADVLTAWRERRNPRADQLPINPGWMS